VDAALRGASSASRMDALRAWVAATYLMACRSRRVPASPPSMAPSIQPSIHPFTSVPVAGLFHHVVLALRLTQTSISPLALPSITDVHGVTPLPSQESILFTSSIHPSSYFPFVWISVYSHSPKLPSSTPSLLFRISTHIHPEPGNATPSHLRSSRSSSLY
jgi:hypothetical protein